MKPNEERAKQALTLIWIVFALEICMIISGLLYYGLLQDIDNGEYVTEETIGMHDMREGIVGILYAVAMIISAVTFIKWMRRAYYNLQFTYKRRLTFEESAAASCWFIPFINLYRPYQIMKEIYDCNKELLYTREAREYVPSSSFIGFWWGLWIFSGIIGNIVFRLSLKAESLDELNDVTVLGIISNLIGIPLALITIKLIRSVSRMETVVYLSEPEPQPAEAASA